MRRHRQILIYTAIAVVVLLIVLVVIDVAFLPFWKTTRVVVREKIDIPRSERLDQTFQARTWRNWRVPKKFDLSDRTGSHTVQITYRKIQITPADGKRLPYIYDFRPSAPSSVDVCDMDLDGISDVIYFDPGDLAILILYRNARGKFRRTQSFATQAEIGIVEDHNKDGQPDIILRTDDGYQVWVLESKRKK